VTLTELDRGDDDARQSTREAIALVEADADRSAGGRYARYRRFPTKLGVVDPEGSAFWQAYLAGGRSVVTGGADTYYSDAWAAAQGLRLAPCPATLAVFLATGSLRP